MTALHAESDAYNTVSLRDVRGDYNGSLIDRYYNERPNEVSARIFEIGMPVVNWWAQRKLDSLTNKFSNNSVDREKQLKSRAKQLRDAIVAGKSVTFIKSGQALALRPDLVKSPEYIKELLTLQDEVGTFDNSIAMKIIEEDLGCDPHSIYEFDPPNPIASASIGQVYKARLKSNNNLVAVKVQRPDAVQTSAIDMYILRKAAAFIKKQKNLRTDTVGIADQFGSQLFSELNYTQEAENCNLFKELYGKIPGIYVPIAYTNLTGSRVLTMEFVEGEKGPWKVGGERMLTIGLQCSVLQLLGTGFFHSDPHRGNLLQTPNGELAYLDFGMMARVPAKSRYALIGVVLGLVNKDLSLAITSMRDLDFFPPETDSEIVVTALTEALKNSTTGGEVSSLNFTKLNQNLQKISNVLPIRLPPFYSMIIRSLTILEGLALYVDPSF